MKPQVSVVLPTRNRLRTLPRAVRSVLAQTMSELELLVVDDGSSDGTAQWLATVGDSRLRILRADKCGAGAARNAGVLTAKAPFIAFQDSDDEWSVQKLEKQLPLLQGESDVGLVYCAVLRWDGAHIVRIPGRSGYPMPDGDIRPVIFRLNIAPTPAWLVRRECFDRVGPFDETLPAVEDWEWMLRFSGQFRARLVDEPLVTVYESGDSLSIRHDSVARALSLIAEKHGDRLRDASTAALGRLHLMSGVRSCMNADYQQGRASFVRGLREHPWGAALPAAWLVSFAGSRAMHRAWEMVRVLGS